MNLAKIAPEGVGKAKSVAQSGGEKPQAFTKVDLFVKLFPITMTVLVLKHPLSSMADRRPTIFKDANHFIRSCDHCQRSGNIYRHQEMPHNSILVCELFDVWGIDFMALFLKSFANEYILAAIYYILKCMEAIPLLTNNARSIVKFLKKYIFTCFDIPQAIISDGGMYFYNRQFENLLS
ncbi:putative mitochondrial protein, partial [Mucuna pruriens]